MKDLSKKLNSEIRKERNRRLNNNLYKDSKSFWNEVNSLMGKKIRGGSEFIIEGQASSDPQWIADSFATFFKNKVDSLIPTGEINSGGLPLGGEWDGGVQLFTLRDVTGALSSLKPKKSVGFDETNNKVIKDLGQVIAPLLCQLFNCILISGEIPRAWKLSKIIPVHKKGDKGYIENYRPVALTSSLSKAFEKCLLKRLGEYGDDTLDGSSQHGFRAKCSTITAALTIQEFIAENLDKDRVVALYSADLTAAFDLLRPKILVQSLEGIGVDKSLIKVISSFLSDRSGYVYFEGAVSSVFDIPIGCAQGSVLGPKLFNIYMSGLEHALPNDVFFTSYADDSYVGLSFEVADFEYSLGRLSEIMDIHFNFLHNKGMVCNRSKTELVVFNRWGDLSIKIPKHSVESVSEMKILGFIFTYNLNWEKHLKKMVGKVNSMSYALRYINSKLSREHFKRLINAHVISRLSYGSQLWEGCVPVTLAQRVKSCYFKFLKLLVKDFKKKHSHRTLLELSGMRSLDSLFKLQSCKLLHSVCTNHTPSQLMRSVLSRGYYNDRHPNRLKFRKRNSMKVGVNSFTNRLWRLKEEMDFEWLELDGREFDTAIKERI